jgi:hypothetical protein
MQVVQIWQVTSREGDWRVETASSLRPNYPVGPEMVTRFDEIALDAIFLARHRFLFLIEASDHEGYVATATPGCLATSN